jgi:hypothetical protein
MAEGPSSAPTPNLHVDKYQCQICDKQCKSDGKAETEQEKIAKIPDVKGKRACFMCADRIMNPTIPIEHHEVRNSFSTDILIRDGCWIRREPQHVLLKINRRAHESALVPLSDAHVATLNSHKKRRHNQRAYALKKSFERYFHDK